MITALPGRASQEVTWCLVAKRSKRKLGGLTRKPNAQVKSDLQAALDELVRRTLTLRDKFSGAHAAGMAAMRKGDFHEAAAAMTRESELIREQTLLAAEFLSILRSAGEL